MFARSLLLLALCLAVAVPGVSLGDPPDHAPAHGYRNKDKKDSKEAKTGDEQRDLEIAFDTERGVQVVVGIPDVFFHEGRFYRQREGSWQVSTRLDGGWKLSASGGVPESILKASSPPGPAKAEKGK